MGFKKNNPGCNCCAGCTICSDDFNRTDDTNIDTGSSCGWTESSGSWDITSARLRCTSAGIAICDAVDGSSSLAQSVSIVAQHTGSGSSVDLIVAYYDASNYVYARFTFGSNTVAIREMVAGVDSSLASGSILLGTSSDYTLSICSDGSGHVKATVASGGSVSCEGATIHASGTQSGLAANGSGTATFDDFVFAHSYNADEFPDCDECFNCSACTTAAPPTQIRLVVAGVLDGTATCVPTANGTFDLDMICDCVYVYNFPSPIITGGADDFIGYVVWLEQTSATNLRVNVFHATDNALIRCAMPTSYIRHYRVLQARSSCLSWSSLNVPIFDNVGSVCDTGTTPATMLVTSIP